MSFDPISWAIGFVLTTALKKNAEELFHDNDLSKKLWRTIELWAANLPAEMQFNLYSKDLQMKKTHYWKTVHQQSLNLVVF